MREEQRSSQPEPCPAGSRARPPWLPPAPPTLGDQPTGGWGGVPDSVTRLNKVFTEYVFDTGTLHKSLANDWSQRERSQLGWGPLPTPEETRARLLQRTRDLRGRLLLDDPDLSEPLLRIFQNELLASALRIGATPEGSMHVEFGFQRFSARIIPAMRGDAPWDWRQYPLPDGTPVMRLIDQPSRTFFRWLLDDLTAAVEDLASYESVLRFDESVARRTVAAHFAATSTRRWVSERLRTDSPEFG